MGKMERIEHFGVLIQKSEKNRITRDNYAVIDKNSSIWRPSICKNYCDQGERKKYYDEECKIYSDSFCEEWQEKCLINFDKNMEFFKRISKESFEEALQKLINFNKSITQIFNLNDCEYMRGIYIMVLDEYKQVYIGQSETNIKKRIMSHWSKRKEFDHLIMCGDVNGSIISIDSFGALDTTRIFVLETDTLDKVENKLIEKIPSKFRLNRMQGGKPEDSIDLTSKVLGIDKRDLREFHNEDFAEKYEKEIDVTYFVSKRSCELKEIVEGDTIRVERTLKGNNYIPPTYGKVIRATKTRLYWYRFCGHIENESCSSSLRITREPEELRIKKTMIFSKVDIVRKKEIRIFWRSKKFPHLDA